MRKRYALLFGLGTVVVSGVAIAQDNGVQSIIGNVFLQNTTPGTAQVGHATITGTFRAGQVFVQQGSTATIPVVGNNTSGTGNTVGGSFSSASPTGIGLRGTATSQLGETVGVFGESRGDGFGVLGRCAIGTAVRGVSLIGTGVAGTSQSGLGVSGITEEGAGVRGEATVTSGIGVQGRNVATTGNAIAGQFQSDSTGGTGILGIVPKTNGFGFGVQGETKSTVGGAGVLGLAPATGAAFGVHGKSLSANGFGVFCEGNQAATGTKSFLIDHPLDPKNRYLRHYCAEGPEPRNVYMGHVRTDERGFAWVRLPDYYDSVNVNPEYQLTVIDSGEQFVLAKVTQKVSGGRFQIRTSEPRVEVSWRIDAVRNDRWMQHKGQSAEPLKPQEFRGTYLNPEFYGQPESLTQSNLRSTQALYDRP